VAGLILAPRGGNFPFLLAVVGVLLAAGIAGARLIRVGQEENSRLTVVTLPQGKETRWVNTLIDEQDCLVFGEAVFHFLGGDSRREHDQLTDGLYRSYINLRETRRIFPSPVIGTYLGLQRPDSFDAAILKPESARHPETAVIFLHGYMGNVTAQCWEIARAVGEFGAVTVCPSTGWRGQWWQADGEAILNATFQYLREEGIEKIYLGGFSNGGYGISQLASKLSSEDGLSGLFFIDGIGDGARIRETGLPILIIQAAQDERVPVERVRETAEVIGEKGTYVELEGDHFIIMKQPEPVRKAIAAWLEDQQARGSHP
jgi:pimeloyl-ACP methyl ester carboxylesterase